MAVSSASSHRLRPDPNRSMNRVFLLLGNWGQNTSSSGFEIYTLMDHYAIDDLFTVSKFAFP